jgi:hypothetical protein
MKNKHYLVYQLTNKINKMIYIGIHVTVNPNDKYMGSGTYLRKAIKKYKLENFEKIILYDFNNENDMLNKEAELVNNQFIARNDTYNIILGGGFIPTNTVLVKDKNNNYFRVHKTDSRWLSGELTSIRKGIVPTKDINGNVFIIDKNDPRYISGELKCVLNNIISVKDKEGNTFGVNKNDPRYLSGELVVHWTGKKHTEESKRKIGAFNAIKQKGKGNSQYGKCWIHNNKESIIIKKEELNKYIKNGWNKGRKMFN